MSPQYKGMRVNLLGLPYSKPDRPQNKSYPKRQYLRSFSGGFRKNTSKNLLLIYDVPEEKKKERDWFRRQLINLDFKMIQRSVWIGPGLPINFRQYVKRIGLQKDFKIFKLAR